MKLINIFVPQDRKTIYAIQAFEKVHLYGRHKVQKNPIRLRCRKTTRKRSVKLYPLNNLRYEHYDFSN